MKIGTTKDYGQFVYSSANRPLDSDNKKYRLLVRSMQKYGWLPSFPMTCVPFGNKRQIVDGQNRFNAAKELGIPVLFCMVSTKEPINIPELNGTQRPWSNDDYVGSYSVLGDENYSFLKEFAERHKISVMVAAGLLRGETSTSSNAGAPLRAGTFTVKDVQFAERVMSLSAAVSEFVGWARHKHFVTVLAEACKLAEFDDERFLARVRSSPGLLIKSPTRDGFRLMLENIYNYRSHSLVPLRVLMESAAKERSAAPKPTK